MAVKAVHDLRSLSVEELYARQPKLRERLARLGMQRHARRLDKTSDLGKAKKDLARLLTVISEKRRAAAQEESS